MNVQYKLIWYVNIYANYVMPTGALNIHYNKLSVIIFIQIPSHVFDFQLFNDCSIGCKQYTAAVVFKCKAKLKTIVYRFILKLCCIFHIYEINSQYYIIWEKKKKNEKLIDWRFLKETECKNNNEMQQRTKKHTIDL